jgi:hypothetical protein
LEEVSIEESEGDGVRLVSGAAFVEGSSGLVVTGSGTPPEHAPVVLSLAASGSLPEGSYTGNVRNVIRVEDSVLRVRPRWCAHAPPEAPRCWKGRYAPERGSLRGR